MIINNDAQKNQRKEVASVNEEQKKSFFLNVESVYLENMNFNYKMCKIFVFVWTIE